MKIQDTYDFKPIARLGNDIVLFSTIEDDERVAKVDLINRNYIVEDLQKLLKFTPYTGIDQKNKEQRKIYLNRIYKSLSDEMIMNLMADMSQSDIEKSETKYTKEHLAEMIVEHERLVKVLSNDKSKENKTEYDRQKKELEEYKEQYKSTNKNEEIKKAFTGKAQIGEVRTHTDGQKYRKVSETGNSRKDWQLVTKDKTGSTTSGDVSKQGTDEGDKKTQHTEKELKEHAQNTSETALHSSVKQSSDPKIREAAHEELDRREKEEKPQEEDVVKKDEKKEKKVAPKESKKEKEADKKEDTVDSLIKEMKTLRDEDLDYSDLSSLEENDKKQRVVREKIKAVKEKEAGLRKVGFEEYRKGFKSFSEDDLNAVDSHYQNDAGKLDFTPIELNSLNLYIEDDHEDFRDLLTSRESFLEKNDDDEEFADDVTESIENVSNFISKNKITENLSLSRRVRGEGIQFFKNLSKGEIYEDKSFSSTSLTEQVQFGDFNIEILAKKGSNVANAKNEEEYEYLIDKGAQFRVLDKSDKGIIVELL